MPERFDAIVIGAGQAGPSLAARLAGAGKRTALIERGRFGGTCVNTGCTPTKTMVASARAVHLASRGAEFGFAAGPIAVDMARVTARAQAVVNRSADGLERWMRETPNISVFQGHGRFTGPHTVVVNGEELEADQIFINVGGRATVPDFSRGAAVPVLTNSSIVALDTLPEHLVIVGGSYIGLEFAQMFRRFGGRVTVIERGPRIIGREDEDVSAGVQARLEAEGVHFRLNAACISLDSANGGITAGVDCSQGSPTIEGTHVLVAVGRRPNTDDLGLEAAGVAVDARGFVTVDDRCRTSVEGIWAVGECNGRGAFTHTAYNDYEIVASQLFENGSRSLRDRFACYALYTDPAVGRVGMTLAEARGSGRRVLQGYRPMTRVSRAIEMGETDGFMRVLVDGETERILGAVVFAVGGDEIVHSIADIMYADVPYTVIARAVHIHPTITELIPTTLQDLQPL